MKFTLNLNVETSRLYSFLVENFKRDFDINEDIVLNNDYEQKHNSGQKVKASLIALTPNEEFALRFVTNLGTSKICYRLQSVGNQTKLIYVETYQANSFLKKLNYQLVSMLLGFYFRKKRIKTFHAIEKYINSQDQ